MREYRAAARCERGRLSRAGLPVETMSRENGLGQYEIDLRPVADACAAADHAILFTRILRTPPRATTDSRHSWPSRSVRRPAAACTSMSSLLDLDGNPVFADEPGAPSIMLGHAVGGLVATMAEAMLLFARTPIPIAGSIAAARPA